MAFDPRHRSKRSHKMPPVRLTDDERLAVEWLASRLSYSDEKGADYSMSDAIRVSLGLAVQVEANKAREAGEPIPDAVRRVLGIP